MVFLKLTIIFMTFPSTLCSVSVNLTSSLKQSYLCPTDQQVTFTCTTAGTDLVWMVNQMMLSYNSIASVGALRSNHDSTITSAFISIWGSSDHGVAYRRAVLTVIAQPGTIDPVTVTCHNGSTNESEQINFLPDTKAPNLTVSIKNDAFDKDLNVWNISWHCGDQETIDYYKLQLNSDPPMLLKNSSAQVVIPDTSRNHTAYIRAVDRCSQEGPVFSLKLTLKEPVTTSKPLVTTKMTDNFEVEYSSARTSFGWHASTTLSFVTLTGVLFHII